MNIKKFSVLLTATLFLFLGIAKISFAYHFDPAVFYYENNSPSSITIGDFNLDDKLDFVVTNGGSHTVSVFLASSTASGLFNQPIDYPEGTSQAGPYGITSGDFNNDGILDLAVTNQGGDHISVLMGSSTATGTFQTAVSYPVVSSPIGITTGDFNNDGLLDLAVDNYGTSTISILMGSSTATGTFQTAVNYPSGAPNSETIVTGDFNNDGVLDLAVNDYYGDRISLLLGSSTATGTFQTAVHYNTGSGPRGITIGDFNGDGISDLAVSNQNTNNISILPASTTYIGGTFTVSTQYLVGTRPKGITSGDFNGDGVTDLAIANQNDNNVSISLNSFNVPGTFNNFPTNYSVVDPNVTCSEGTSPYDMASGDFNGDGIPDLAVLNINCNGIAIFLSRPERFWVGGDGSWSDAANHWATSTGGNPNSANLPTASDDVFFDINSSNGGSTYAVTMDTNAYAHNLTMSSGGDQVVWQGASTLYLYGSLNLLGGAGPIVNNYTGDIRFEATSGTSTIASHGVTYGSALVFEGMGGTWQLSDNLESTGPVDLVKGTLDANDHNITTNQFFSSFSNTRTLKMGSGTWTLVSDGIKWDIATTTGLTFDSGSSTILINDSTAIGKDFFGGGLSYNTVTFSGDNIFIIGNNTFDTMNVDNAGLPSGLVVARGSTQTVTNFTTDGFLNNLAIIRTVSGINPFKLLKIGGTVSVDYMYIVASAATGTATWYAGAHSFDGGQNSGWIFTAPPSTSTPPTHGGGSSIILPTVSIYSSYTSIPYNSSTNISWSSENVNSCSITKNGILWNSNTSGSNISSGNLTSDTTFTATCIGSLGNEASSSVTIKVSSSQTVIPTIVVLINGENASTSTNKTTPPVYQFSFTKILKLGSVGDEVKQLQIFLNTHGFPLSQTGNGSRGHETSYFGLKTKAALIKFQEAHAQDILAPQNLIKGTGIFWIYSKKIANQILLGQ